MKPAIYLLALWTLAASPAHAADALAPDSIEYVLAASWEPAFCRSSDGRDKEECRTLTADRLDATHFALHGLWPEDLDDKRIFPCYCDRGEPLECGRSQRADTDIPLSDDVLSELSIAMPGVQSGLHRHVWTKHGSCYEDDKTGAYRGADPDEYFSEAMALLDQLNSSPLQVLFGGNIGGRLSRKQIEAAFDRSFGKGASARLTIRCSGRGEGRMISELWINLAGDITPESRLAGLISAAPPTSESSDARNCTGGRVADVESN
jgi:ribonuclease T2